MKKYEQSELKLNEYAVPTNFHDMSIVNMEFENDKLIIKFSLAEYLDDFNILEDDKHHAILQVVYEGIKIEKMNLTGVIDFRTLDVYHLYDENGVIELHAYNRYLGCYLLFKFSITNYKWSVVDVIPSVDYYNFRESLSECEDELSKFRDIELPSWAKI